MYTKKKDLSLIEDWYHNFQKQKNRSAKSVDFSLKNQLVI